MQIERNKQIILHIYICIYIYNSKKIWGYESLLTNDGRCTLEIKSRIAMAKAAFSKK